jgi:malate dehydrogenase
MKISIIGAGNVGGLTAMRIAQENLGDLALIDIAPGLAKGKAFDLDDAAPLSGGSGAVFGSENIHALDGSDIVVVTAGLARKPGMTREDLLEKNAHILDGVCRTITDRAPDAVVIVVTNPLDAMTWYCVKRLGFGNQRVFGMGVTLDAARFANIIAKELSVPSTEVEACVIASHGEGMLPLPRFTFINGTPLPEVVPDPQKLEMLCRKTVERGKEIVSLLGSGSAYFAPSAAICQLVRAVARDQKARCAASVYLSGHYGVKDICMGVPCIIGRSGVEQIIELNLSAEEKKAFRSSAQAVRQMCELFHV